MPTNCHTPSPTDPERHRCIRDEGHDGVHISHAHDETTVWGDDELILPPTRYAS